MPTGYHSLRCMRQISRGQERLDQAAGRLLSWDMHRRAGLTVRTASAHVVQGDLAILRLGVVGIGVHAPVRVAYLVDQPHRRGFAYGPLPGHPESGEEAFVIELRDDDAVTFTITAFSRPSPLLARAGGPISRALQSRLTNRYLRSV